MIKIEEKERCCGCSVCAQVCPQQCIKMTVDDEGFYYPKVNESQCVKCGICDKTCPILNNAANQRESPLAFAAYNLDEQERLQSSSGGLFSLIARATLQAGGVVFGASMADDCYTVNHIRVETERELHLLQGSKYLQSDVKTTFRQAKIDLETGRLVLYSGTPCQIGGLRTFLKKDYDNLLCVDVVCHGVPSPKLWKKYLKYRENRAGAAARRTFFRHKGYGWKMFAVLFEFSNNTAYKQILYKDLFMQMFLQNICLRPSCYSCAYKGLEDAADISLADFWGAESIYPDMDDDKGLSLVLIHTEKGRVAFEKIRKSTKSKQVTFDQAVASNRAIIESCVKPQKREAFMKNLDNDSIEQLAKEYLKQQSIATQARIWLSINVKKKIKNLIKRG